jgi:hypothetical protein
MTAKKPSLPTEINPHFSYRINSTPAIAVTGLGPTQQREAWKKGELPVPPRLTPDGPYAYVGQQLIDVQKKRLAEAQAEEKRLAAERAATTAHSDVGSEENCRRRRRHRVGEATDAS